MNDITNGNLYFEQIGMGKFEEEEILHTEEIRDVLHGGCSIIGKLAIPIMLISLVAVLGAMYLVIFNS